LTSDDLAPRLAEFLAGAAKASGVRIEGLARLAGGAIQEHVGFRAIIEGGPLAGTHELVIRSEARASVPESRPLREQFALVRAAHAAGVAVPDPMWFSDDPAVLGKPFYVMRRMPGVALGSRVVRGAPHSALAERLAGELARIHAIFPPRSDLLFLGAPPASPALDEVAKYRAYLDREPDPHPALEWGLRWLERNAAPPDEIVLAHHDFRTGNYLVDDGRLTAVLDWEFAGWSEPIEDIGWFCAKCWRFGSNAWEAGGIAPKETFVAAYERASGRRIDRARIAYWEVMAHVRWATIALHQTGRHKSGVEPSLELALIGSRLPELEFEILSLTEHG
jgi:aminoglycoside phosphotransferase (APT) family kinase protein